AFDPGTNRWTEKRPLPGAGLSHANVAVVGDRLFLLGPNPDGQVLKYDPDGDSWSEGKAALRQFTDRGAAAIGVSAGKIYVVGGSTAMDLGPGGETFEVFTP